MIREFLKQFTTQPEAPKSTDVGLAAAVLLVEVTKADHTIDESEHTAMLAAIDQLCPNLDANTSAESLLEEALNVSKSANDMQRFTSVIHDQWSNAQKSELLIALWKVAYANDELDKYEEHIIRRIADLIYIPHSEFIRTKLIARDQ